MGKIMKYGISYGGNGGSSDISYNDLEDKPSINNVELSGNKTTEDLGIHIPTVNNSTITIQKNGTDVDSFTTNANANKSINITVPTNTSDLNNDSGFITSSALPTVNNSTITIQKNGTDVDSFTTNASSAKTINLTLSKSDVGLSNVENKSSATIRSELTASNVTTALGYTPAGWTVLSLTQTVSTSGNTTYTFSNANIKTTSTIDVYTDVFGYMPSAISTSNGSCVVTMPSYSSAISVTVKIYVIN